MKGLLIALLIVIVAGGLVFMVNQEAQSPAEITNIEVNQTEAPQEESELDDLEAELQYDFETELSSDELE